MSANKPLNIINVEDVDIYLKKFCGDDKRLAIFLIAALSNVIRKAPESMEQLNSLPNNPPSWLLEKWSKSEIWHRFNDKLDIRLAGRVYDVVNWIEDAIMYDMEWIKNLDGKQRPLKLLNISSYEHLLDVMKKDEVRISQKRQQISEKMLIEEGIRDDFKKVMLFEDGYYIVRLKTEEALDIEGAYLDHCIGDGGYDHWLGGNVKRFYSLRDSNNLPCVSMSVRCDEYSINEIKGRKNSFPKEKYIPYIATFCDQAGYFMCSALSFDEGFNYLHDG